MKVKITTIQLSTETRQKIDDLKMHTNFTAHNSKNSIFAKK